MVQLSLFAVFALFLAVRILSVFVVRSWYFPDEYWQSLEVAHNLTFGYGYLTWEWLKGIRSYIHPLFISTVYHALNWMDLDHVEYLTLAPRVLQALLSAVSDYHFYRWSNYNKWSIYLIATSWFWFFMGSRTLLNTFETCLTTIALSKYPSTSTDKKSTSFLWIVALLCFIRPTAAILWFPLCIFHMLTSTHSITELFKRYLMIGSIVGGAAIALDSYAYGAFIVTPIEFFKLNIWQNVSSHYGTHSWYHYLIIGLPTILGPFTIPFLFACIQLVLQRHLYPDRMRLLYAAVFSLIVYSVLGHKEDRFILPLLPICLHITAESFSFWSRNVSRRTIWIVSVSLFTINVASAIQNGWQGVHGNIDVMRSVERIAREYRDPDGNRANFIFLVLCHTTPWYSHVHQNITMRFLTCHPNVFNEQPYTIENADFHKDPPGWLQSNILIHPKSTWPTHVVLFNQTEPQIRNFLKNYKLIEIFEKFVLLYEHVFDVVEPDAQPLAKLEPNRFNAINLDESVFGATLHNEL